MKCLDNPSGQKDLPDLVISWIFLRENFGQFRGKAINVLLSPKTVE